MPIAEPVSQPRLVLGTYGAAHLGDALCSTPLPRLLAEAGVNPVYISERQVCRGVFANNPYVAGFAEAHALSLDRRVRGAGHIIQRMLNSFELPLRGSVKPELYFTDEELEWARGERKIHGGGKPICILASRAFTDAWHLTMVDWRSLATILRESFTVIHPVLTNRTTYEKQIGGAGDGWNHEPEIPDAITYRDLPLRRYLSLFTIADLYFGGPSGGSHVAAALDVPAFIILWRKKIQSLVFPVPATMWSVDVFLYPQHQFVPAEELNSMEQIDALGLREMLASVGRSDLQTRIDHRPAWGVSPIAPRRVIQTGSGRLVRTLGIYGDGKPNSPWAPGARV